MCVWVQVKVYVGGRLSLNQHHTLGLVGVALDTVVEKARRGLKARDAYLALRLGQEDEGVADAGLVHD